MDVLKETEELYKIQKERVTMDVKWEMKMQKTFPSLNNDIRLLKELLEDVRKRREEMEEVGNIPDSI